MSEHGAAAMSRALPQIARDLAELLDAAAGERVAFVLLTGHPGPRGGTLVNYVANVARPDGANLIGALLDTWAKGKGQAPDIPYHEKV